MRIAYLECFSGISGDMFLGALIDAGVPPRLLEEAVAALDVGARLEISRVVRSGISASKVDVWVRSKMWRGRPRPRNLNTSMCTIMTTNTKYDHEHSRAGAPAPHSHEHGRGLSEIREIIKKAAISDTARQTAISIFEALGTAEAKIHGTSIENVHFHEVGAVDAMVDIVCAAVGAEALGVDEIICSPLNVGGGSVKCAHGTFPVPAPATVELLKDALVYSTGIQAELVTPTGAAIVKTLATRFASVPGNEN